MNSIYLSLLINGYPIKKAVNLLNKISNFNNVELENYIANQKRYIINYHLKNNEFYKNLLKKKNPYKWEDIPVIKKNVFQIETKNLMSNDYNKFNVFLNKTSGSSGVPLEFCKDKFCHAMVWANTFALLNKHNLSGKKQARYYGLPKDFKEKYLTRIKDFFANRYRFDVFDLSDKAFSNWVKKFSKTKFVYLNGYTTVIVAFSDYLIRKNIFLNQICPTLKACIVTSEMCSESDRKKIKKALGVSVINEYGLSELDIIAFHNNNNEWKINRETLFIEILNKDNEPVEYGKTGRIVVTSFFNKAMPFIRYETGDLGSIIINKDKEHILKAIEGRKDDLIYLPSGKIAAGMTFYNFTKRIMSSNPIIKELKAFQTDKNIFEIHYTSIREINEVEKENLKNKLFDFLEPNLEINFIRFEHLERTQSGKLKQFTSLIK